VAALADAPSESAAAPSESAAASAAPTRAAPTSAVASAAPTAATGVAPSAPAKPAPVRLRVTGPAGADVLLDGRAYGQLPLDVQLPPQGASRVVEVRVAGYLPYVRPIAGDHDVTFEAAPKRRAPTPHAPPRRSSEIKDPFKL
jgi:hypothetical protein